MFVLKLKIESIFIFFKKYFLILYGLLRQILLKIKNNLIKQYFFIQQYFPVFIKKCFLKLKITLSNVSNSILRILDAIILADFKIV
jgi:hypothetical protein